MDPQTYGHALSHPAFMCMILSPLRSSKAFLVPQGFVPLTQHTAPCGKKALYTPREGTPYELGSRNSLKRCGTIGTQCLTHTLGGEMSSALIPFVMPRPSEHDIVLFGRPEGFLSPLSFCSSHAVHSPLLEKALYTLREGTPYELGFGCLLKRCGTLGTQCLTHTLREESSLALIPSVMPYPHVHDIFLFGRPEGSLSPLRFCSFHAAHNPLWEKASYTPREGTPSEPGSGCLLK